MSFDIQKYPHEYAQQKSIIRNHRFLKPLIQKWATFNENVHWVIKKLLTSKYRRSGLIWAKEQKNLKDRSNFNHFTQCGSNTIICTLWTPGPNFSLHTGLPLVDVIRLSEMNYFCVFCQSVSSHSLTVRFINVIDFLNLSVDWRAMKYLDKTLM